MPQKDIVFLVCDALKIVNAGIPYCFTDGNATKAISKFYIRCMGCVNWIGLVSMLPSGRTPRMIMTGSERKCQNSLSDCKIKVDTDYKYYFRRYD